MVTISAIPQYWLHQFSWKYSNPLYFFLIILAKQFRKFCSFFFQFYFMAWQPELHGSSSDSTTNPKICWQFLLYLSIVSTNFHENIQVRYIFPPKFSKTILKNMLVFPSILFHGLQSLTSWVKFRLHYESKNLLTNSVIPQYWPHQFSWKYSIPLYFFPHKFSETI